MANSAMAAAQSIAVLLAVAYITVRLTFVGSPNPPFCCLFSERVTDLANEITNCSGYAPKMLVSCSQLETPAPKLLSSMAPLTKPPPRHNFPAPHIASVISYIYDMINCFPDTEEKRAKQPYAVPCTSRRPHRGDNKLINRQDSLSGQKLVAKGAPAKEQIVLGWMLDTQPPHTHDISYQGTSVRRSRKSSHHDFNGSPPIPT